MSRTAPFPSRALIQSLLPLPSPSRGDSGSGLVLLPPPLSILAPVPRHLRLHASLQEQLQAERERDASVSPPPLFALHTRSSANSNASQSRTSSPSSCPSLADHFPPLQSDADAHDGQQAVRPTPSFPAYPPVIRPPSPASPPFLFTSHLSLSPHPHHRSALPFALASLSPDPKAFLEPRELLKKTPKNSAKACPPTPMRLKRPANLQRASSLYDTKLLAERDDLTPMKDVDGQGHGHGHEHRTPTGDGGQQQLAQSASPSPAREAVTFDSHFSQPQLVGEGSFFSVFRAVEVASGAEVAIKRSLRTFRGKKDREGYMREWELIRGLGEHPHIVQLVRCWQEELHMFIQMEYLPHTLDSYNDLCEQRGTKTTTQLYGWMYQLCLALRHLHSRGLLHLDIKPENVLVTERGVLKLGDFGSARGVQEVGDGSEGDCRYAALELLHVHREDDGRAMGSMGMGNAELRTENISLHPARMDGNGPPHPTPPVRAPLAPITSSLSCPTTPSPHISNAAICPATGTSSPKSSRTPLSACSSSASLPGASSSSSPVSFGTDMFSLGLLLLEVASSIELPKDGLVWHELREGRAHVHVLGKVGGATMERLILSCLNQRVEDRPSAAELIERLKPIVDKEALMDIGVQM